MKNKILQIILISIVLIFTNVSIAFSHDLIPGEEQKKPIALVGGTIHTITQGNLENATILFQNGKISGIGNNINIPENTQVIYIQGKHVYPGLIASYSKMGLVEIDAVRSTRDFYEVGEITPNVRAEVAFNPDSEIIPVSRSNGITSVLSVPDGDLIAGTSALMMMDGWTWEGMTIKAPVGLHIYWPIMDVNKSAEEDKQEEQREKIQTNISKIKKAFKDAKTYMNAKESENKKNIPYHDTDLKFEAMIPILKKQIPVFVHANEIKQIQAVVDWAEEENVKLVIVGGYDSWRVSDLLKEKNIPVIIAGIHRTPWRRWEAYDTVFTLPKKLYESGVKFCISNTGDAFETSNERNVPYNAASAAAYGLPKEEALKSITIYPAEILGVGNKLGSLEMGKDATVIVTNGDPLEILTNIEMEFIQGRYVDLNNRHKQLYNKYKEKYKQLNIIKP